ncbi:MAG: ASKHA domain-containing protein [bacterium]|nr:ASKHA domain-containing protein [bacterium]
MRDTEGNFVYLISCRGVEPNKGETLGELMRRSGDAVAEPCGGRGTCGKCRVKVEGIVPDCAETERLFLTDEDIEAGIRLACITPAKKGMVVSRVDEIPRSMKILSGEKDAVPLYASDKDGRALFSVAIDLGTTTLVAYLVNKSSGAVIAVSSVVNPQVMFGADIISRISYASKREDALAVLQNRIVDAVNRLIFNLQRRAAVSEEEITEVVVSGNTTMEHIFAGVSPTSIGKAPFTPQYREFPPLTAARMNMALSPETAVRFLPNISGFVGGDITAGIIYTGMAKSEKLSLLIDIGTNNEMVLGCKDFLLCCSAAAGPALEGAKISQGMCASEGAIDHVKKGLGGICVSTIDNAPAVGICGSGLVDAITILLEEGIIDKSGKFAKPSSGERDLFERLDVERKRFLLSKSSKKSVFVTQKDIRELQLAKSAIYTGIEIMLDEAGKELEDIERVFLAGAFGNYLNIENAMKVGILPRLPLEKIKSVGNSSGLGAIEFILHSERWEEAKEVISSTKHIELATHRGFPLKFVKNLSFYLP